MHLTVLLVTLIAAVSLISAPLAAQVITLPTDVGDMRVLSLTVPVPGTTPTLRFKGPSGTLDIPLGAGFDSLTGLQRGVCVQGTYHAGDNDDDKRLNTEYDILLVKSSEQFRKTAELSGSAAFGFGIWSVDAASKYFRSENITRNSDYLYVRTRVTGVNHQLLRDKTLKFTAEANALLQEAIRLRKSGHANAFDKFKKQCGNFFILGVKAGGEFSAIYRFESEDEAQRAALQASLKVAARPYGNVSAEFSEAIEKIRRHQTLSAKIVRNATNEAVPNEDIPSLIAYAKSFPQKINRETAVPIELVKLDYQALNGEAEIFSDEADLLEKWARILGAGYEGLADIDFASRHRAAIYPILSEATIDARRREIEAFLATLETVAKECARKPDTCKSGDSSVHEPQFRIPGRAQRRPLNPRANYEQEVGAIGPDEERRVVILGEWSAWAGPGIWWPPERCCFEIVYVHENGRRTKEQYNPNLNSHVYRGPGIVKVLIGDSTYDDNQARDLEAIVYRDVTSTISIAAELRERLPREPRERLP